MTAPALTGVFETLIQQHRKLLELLQEAGALRNPERRQEKWTEARQLLRSHERAETHVLYAQLEDQSSARGVVEQHRRQADELEWAVGEVEGADRGTQEWIEHLRDLMALLDDHIRDEEQEFFPLAQELLGERRAAELQDPLIAAQRDIAHQLG